VLSIDAVVWAKTPPTSLDTKVVLPAPLPDGGVAEEGCDGELIGATEAPNTWPVELLETLLLG
jgi:hypothetical protein